MAEARRSDEAFCADWVAGQGPWPDGAAAEFSLVKSVVSFPVPGAGAEQAARHRRKRRARQVCLLVAVGPTGREIAAGLALSRRAVNAHVARILTSFDVPTRRHAADRGRELGLVAGRDGSARTTYSLLDCGIT